MILDDIVVATKDRIETQKRIRSLEELRYQAIQVRKEELAGVAEEAGVAKEEKEMDFPFEKALKNHEKGKAGIIGEVKKASPSKGIFMEEFPFLDIAKSYEKIGVSAISVLTEPFFFKGKNEYLTQISEAISLPILRKDFVIDEYMIYEAKVIGAHAVLLICSILDQQTLVAYLKLADSLGLSALVETHDEAEIAMAVQAGARIIGVNNRKLKTFEVDMQHSINLKSLVPEDIIFVSESGIRGDKDILELEAHNVDAVLIGEAMIKKYRSTYQLTVTIQ